MDLTERIRSSDRPTSGSRPRRVVLVIAHLGIGGAQRVASNLAAHWVESGHDLTVVMTNDQRDDFYQLPPSVTRLTLRDPKQKRMPPIYRVWRWIVNAGLAPLEPRPSSPAWFFVVALTLFRRGYRLVTYPIRLLFSNRMRRATLAVCVRYRLLGGSGYRYAGVLRFWFWRTRALRKLLRELHPDVVISMLGATNIMTVCASVGLSYRTVISERNDPSKQRLKSPWQELRPVIYPMADVVSANSTGALESMRAFCPEEKLCYTPNPLVFGDRVDDGARTNSMLFLGRLVHQKAPDVLIEAFARFTRAIPGWRLDIAGDGPMAEALQARVQQLGVDADVVFHGLVHDPIPLLRACRIFVLPSRFEGTPNALLEAMAHRLACIVSDASPGPLQLIVDGVTGRVVQADRVDSLAEALGQLAGNSSLQRSLGEAAFQRVQEFSLERVSKVWDHILFPDESTQVVSASHV